MPFGFRRKKGADDKAGAKRGDAPGASSGRGIHAGAARGVAFTALTEDWREIIQRSPPGVFGHCTACRPIASIDDGDTARTVGIGDG